jgi:hypothetical protein
MAERPRYVPPAVLGAVLRTVRETPVSFGGRPDPELMKRSAQFADGRFRELAPQVAPTVQAAAGLLR